MDEATRKFIESELGSLNSKIGKAINQYKELKGRLSRINKYANWGLYELYEKELGIVRDSLMQLILIKGALEAVLEHGEIEFIDAIRAVAEGSNDTYIKAYVNYLEYNIAIRQKGVS